ncbi:Hypothetical protein D9617_16g015220 [Elsinoe fawcettii]|nr:Hypothetical protein D9617_16g015220 [Elsinoe fawcettii]
MSHTPGPTSPSSTAMETSQDKPRIDVVIPRSSFSSLYRIPDELASNLTFISHANSPPTNPPPPPPRSLLTSSWRTASSSCAISSVSIDLSSLRPYRAHRYQLSDEDRVTRGEGSFDNEEGGGDPPPYFEGFDGGPYVTEEEEFGMASPVADLRGRKVGMTLRERGSAVLQRPWTSMSERPDGEMCRYERRIMVKREVEGAFRKGFSAGEEKREGERVEEQQGRGRGTGEERAWWDGRGSGLGELRR